MNIVNRGRRHHHGDMNVTLGQLVVRAMERRGIKGYQLATEIGKQASYVSRLINDEIKEVLPPSDLEALARVLGLSQAEMLRALGYQLGESEGVRYPEGSLQAEALAKIGQMKDAQLDVVVTFMEMVLERQRHVADGNSRSNSGPLKQEA
jgi:transcriptional regulator with XRE-family HTH domain